MKYTKVIFTLNQMYYILLPLPIDEPFFCEFSLNFYRISYQKQSTGFKDFFLIKNSFFLLLIALGYGTSLLSSLLLLMTLYIKQN